MFITTSAVARLLESSEATVRQLANRGQLPCIVLASGLRLYRRDVVERLAVERQAQRDARRETAK